MVDFIAKRLKQLKQDSIARDITNANTKIQNHSEYL